MNTTAAPRMTPTSVFGLVMLKMSEVSVLPTDS